VVTRQFPNVLEITFKPDSKAATSRRIPKSFFSSLLNVCSVIFPSIFFCRIVKSAISNCLGDRGRMGVAHGKNLPYAITFSLTPAGRVHSAQGPPFPRSGLIKMGFNLSKPELIGQFLPIIIPSGADNIGSDEGSQ
jgi:hypothetical protein